MNKRLVWFFSLFFLLILGIVSCFFIGAEAEDSYFDKTIILERWKSYNLEDFRVDIDENSENKRMIFSLENDGKSYMLTGFSGFNFTGWDVIPIAEYQNIFGQRFYLHYVDDLFLEQTKQSYFTLDPYPQWLIRNDFEPTACQLLGLEQDCIFVGNLKKRNVVVRPNPAVQNSKISIE